ncbi:unnamed protein product, partial [Rotaria socialis]
RPKMFNGGCYRVTWKDEQVHGVNIQQSSNISSFFFLTATIDIDLSAFFSLFNSTMALCRSDRYNLYGYLDLKILNEYGEYANSLCEFVLNTIVVDYVVQISIKNHKNSLNSSQSNYGACISLNNINLDTDFIPYGEKMRRIW